MVRARCGGTWRRRARPKGAPTGPYAQTWPELLTRMQICGGTSVLTNTALTALRPQSVRDGTRGAGLRCKRDEYDETISLLSLGSCDRRYTYIEHSQGSLGASQRCQTESGVPACDAPFLDLRLHKLQEQSRARRRNPLQSSRSEWPSHDHGRKAPNLSQPTTFPTVKTVFSADL